MSIPDLADFSTILQHNWSVTVKLTIRISKSRSFVAMNVIYLFAKPFRFVNFSLHSSPLFQPLVNQYFLSCWGAGSEYSCWTSFLIVHFGSYLNDFKHISLVCNIKCVVCIQYAYLTSLILNTSFACNISFVITGMFQSWKWSIMIETSTLLFDSCLLVKQPKWV